MRAVEDFDPIIRLLFYEKNLRRKETRYIVKK